jgi:hypothetical protein
MRRFAAILLSLLFVVSPLISAPVSQQMMPAGAQLVLQDGTPVKLRLNRNLSSADAKVGEQIDFEVLEEIRVGDLIVIPKGGIALGSVTDAKGKGRMGKGGKLDVTIDYVRLADGEKTALRAVRETKGGGSTGAMTAGIVAASLVVWPAAPFFLFMHGKDITIPKGTEITAYVNGDFKIPNPAAFSTITTPQPGSAAAVQAASANPSAAGNQNSIMVSSTPAGADIEVDGAFVGSTPSIVNIAPGDHTISIKKRGFRLWERKIRATGGSIKIDAELESGT